MTEIKVKDKDIVVPGETLATGMDFLPASGTYREEDQIISSQLGIVSINKRLIRVIPLNGRYIPKEGDIVIGKVTNVGFGLWFVDIGYAYEAGLSIRDATSFIERGADLTKFYDFGEMLVAQVVKVNRSTIDLSTKGPGLKKLKGGKIIQIIPSKVPRVIGKQGSMISIVKEKTKCNILVGQNGRVWISGEDPKMELLATRAIIEIEKNAHKSGLTDHIVSFLDKESKK